MRSYSNLKSNKKWVKPGREPQNPTNKVHAIVYNNYAYPRKTLDSLSSVKIKLFKNT